MENNLAVSYDMKHLTYDPAFNTRKMKTCPHQDLYINSHSSFIHNGAENNRKTRQMSINRGADRANCGISEQSHINY